MPIDTISAPYWLSALKALPQGDATQQRLSRILTDIITESVDPVVGTILDRHTREILR
jgi:hypothetical protein